MKQRGLRRRTWRILRDQGVLNKPTRRVKKKGKGGREKRERYVFDEVAYEAEQKASRTQEKVFSLARTMVEQREDCLKPIEGPLGDFAEVDGPLTFFIPPMAVLAKSKVEGNLSEQAVQDLLPIMEQAGALKHVRRGTALSELNELAMTFLCELEVDDPDEQDNDETVTWYAHDDGIYMPADESGGHQNVICIGWAWQTPLWRLVSGMAALACYSDLFSNHMTECAEHLQEQLKNPEMYDLDQDPERLKQLKAEIWNQPWWKKVMEDMYWRSAMLTSRYLYAHKELLSQELYMQGTELIRHMGVLNKEDEHQNLDRHFLTQVNGGDAFTEDHIHLVLWGYGGEGKGKKWKSTAQYHLNTDIDELVDTHMQNDMCISYVIKRYLSANGKLTETSTHDLSITRAHLRNDVQQWIEHLQKHSNAKLELKPQNVT